MTDMEVVRRLDRIINIMSNRLPEREAACGDVWRDETERPCTRPSGHDGNHVDKVGTIWANPEPSPADVDPDEALAKAMYDADPDDAGMTWEENIGSHDAFRTLARAAREHILVNEHYEYDLLMRDRNMQAYRAEKAEADLALVTKERDNWRESSRDSKHAAKRAEQ